MPGTLGEVENPFGKTLTIQTGPIRILGECLRVDDEGMFVIREMESGQLCLVLPRAEVLLIHN